MATLSMRDAFRQLGGSGPKVFPLALGCMGMSGRYGHADEDESVKAIQAALDRGVTRLDTGDFYGMGHNEMLIGSALKAGGILPEPRPVRAAQDAELYREQAAVGLSEVDRTPFAVRTGFIPSPIFKLNIR